MENLSCMMGCLAGLLAWAFAPAAPGFNIHNACDGDASLPAYFKQQWVIVHLPLSPAQVAQYRTALVAEELDGAMR